MNSRRPIVLIFATWVAAVSIGFPANCLGASEKETSAPSADDLRNRRAFAIQVVDEQTGRGVPLVELKTIAGVRYYTDSAGLAAIDDPALVGQKVYFHVFSHGYEFPADGYGFKGVKLELTPGGSAQVKIKRVNVAERLYRLTGEGIYRDSVILGRPTPIQHPLLDAQVTGQDSALAAVYRGKIHWFFGDTLRPAYPLGQYWTAGATSELPGKGKQSLDCAVGVDLDYYTDAEGFSRGVLPRLPGMPCWLDGLMVLPGGDGSERLVARCSIMKDLGHCVARRLVVFNDGHDMFDILKEIPLDVPLAPVGHPFPVKTEGTAYFYSGVCLPDRRVKADLAHVQDFSSYEGFTCLAPGSHYDKDRTAFDRDADGRLIWGWKKDTAALEKEQVSHLVSAGKLRTDELWFRPMDVEMRKPVRLATGSVAYNTFRHKWVMIAGEEGGASSYLGEIYYAEADEPQGPWPWARKIITHDRYSLYNPVQHPFFEQEGGRLIYFQGTYTATFSRGEAFATPRYEYNQIMYRLDLSDPRLKLPEPPATAPASSTMPR